MIGAAIRVRMRARAVGDGGALAYGGYVFFEYAPDAPYEVRLVESGPYGREETFAREILAAALDGAPAGLSQVRAQLKFIPAAGHSMVLVTIVGPDGDSAIALNDAAVATFLRDTTDLVPLGEESQHLDIDTGLDQILRDAA